MIRNLLAYAKPLIDTIGAAAKIFADLPAPIQLGILAFAGLLAAMGPILLIVGTMATGVATLLPLLGVTGLAGGVAGVGVAAATTATVTGLLASALALLTAPLTLGIAAAGLAAVAIYAIATAESDLEKALKGNSDEFRKNTSALDSSLQTYTDLKSKLLLTTEESDRLAAATSALAQASGLSKDAFEREATASSGVVDALRTQLSARRELMAAAVLQGRQQVTEAEAALNRTKALLGDVLDNKAQIAETSGGAGGGGVLVRNLSANERNAEIVRLNASITSLTGNVDKARVAYTALVGPLSTAQQALVDKTLAQDMTTGWSGVEGLFTNRIVPAIQKVGTIAKDTSTLLTQLNATYEADLKKIGLSGFKEIFAAHETYKTSVKDLATANGVAETSINRYFDSVRDGAKAVRAGESDAKKLAAAIATIRDAAIPLTEAQQQMALANEKLTISHADTARVLGVNVNAIDTYIKGVKNAEAVEADWVKLREDFATKTEKLQLAMRDKFTADQRKEADASAASMVKLLGDREKYQSRVNEIGLSGFDLALKHIDDQQTAEIRSLGERTEQNARFHDQNRTAIEAYYAYERRLALGTSDTIVERMARQGVQTKAVLRDQADTAKRDYEQMRRSGEFSAAAVGDAWTAMYDAQVATAGRWFRAVADISSKIAQAFSSHCAQMLTGAESFKTGLIGIWQSIKQSLTSVFAEIADAFIQGMLKRMLAAWAGAKFTGAAGGSDGASGLGQSLTQQGESLLVKRAASLLGMGGGAATTTTVGLGGEATVLSTAGGATLGTGGIAGTSAGSAASGTGAGLTTGATGLALGIGASVGGGIAAGMLGKYLAGGAGQKAGAIGAAGGFAAGATIGTFVFPGVGTLVGGGIGALAGYLTGVLGKSKGAKEDQAANKDLDATRAGLLAQFKSMENIAALDKAIGTDLAAGWGAAGKKGAIAFAAEALRFETTLKAAESAGVTLTDLLAIGQPEQTLEQRLTKINGLIAELGKTGGVASKDLIRLRDAMGDTDEVKAFKTQQSQGAAGGVGTFLANATVSDQTGASAIGDTLQGSYATMRAQGASTREAFAALRPMVDAFNKQLGETGLTGGASFGTLASLAGIAGNEISGKALEAINGLSTALAGAQNAGFLTQSMFTGLTGEIVKQRDAILATGASSEDVNALMQGDLQTIWRLQKDFNFQVDDGTQALLDQAEASGVVGDKYRSAMDRAAIAMEKVAATLETVIGKTNGVTAAIGRIPSTKTVTITYDEQGRPSADTTGMGDTSQLPAGYQPRDYPDDPSRRFAQGGLVLPFATGGLVPAVPRYAATGGAMGRLVDFVPKGTDTVPAMLTVDEGVVTVPGMDRLEPAGLDAVNHGRPLPPRILQQLADPITLRAAAVLSHDAPLRLAAGGTVITTTPRAMATAMPFATGGRIGATPAAAAVPALPSPDRVFSQATISVTDGGVPRALGAGASPVETLTTSVQRLVQVTRTATTLVTGTGEIARGSLSSSTEAVDGLSQTLGDLPLTAKPWQAWATSAAASLAVVNASVEALMGRVAIAAQGLQTLPQPSGPLVQRQPFVTGPERGTIPGPERGGIPGPVFGGIPGPERGGIPGPSRGGVSSGSLGGSIGDLIARGTTPAVPAGPVLGSVIVKPADVVVNDTAYVGKYKDRMQTATVPRYFADGGVVDAIAPVGRVLYFAPRGTDTVPAMLTRKEYVLDTATVAREGVPALRALQQGTATVVPAAVASTARPEVRSSELGAQSLQQALGGPTAHGSRRAANAGPEDPVLAQAFATGGLVGGFSLSPSAPTPQKPPVVGGLSQLDAPSLAQAFSASRTLQFEAHTANRMSVPAAGSAPVLPAAIGTVQAPRVVAFAARAASIASSALTSVNRLADVAPTVNDGLDAFPSRGATPVNESSASRSVAQRGPGERQRADREPPVLISNHYAFEIKAMDGASVRRVIQSSEFQDELENQILKNTHGQGLGTAIRRAAGKKVA